MKTLNAVLDVVRPRSSLNSAPRPKAQAAIASSQLSIGNWSWPFVAALLLAPMLLFAQQYSIDWYKVAGGGGTSTGGSYSVSGTIGQHDAGGPMTGGSYSLAGGFWALFSVVQTPGAPTLYITGSGNTVTLFWQDVSGWSLQQNNNLTVPAGWTGSSGVMTANGTNYLNITSPTGNLFFRLTNP